MKKKHKKNVHKKANAKNVLFVVFVFALSLYLLFLAFYSYGAVSADDLEVRAVEIVNVERHSRVLRRVGWYSFLTSDNETFYVRFEGPNRGALYEFYNSEALPISAKVSYANRPDLLFWNIITYGNRHRLATLEIDGNVIIGLEHYNAVNSGKRVAFTIVSAIIVLAATFPYWFIWLLQFEGKKRKRKKYDGSSS